MNEHSTGTNLDKQKTETSAKTMLIDFMGCTELTSLRLAEDRNAYKKFVYKVAYTLVKRVRYRLPTLHVTLTLDCMFQMDTIAEMIGYPDFTLNDTALETEYAGVFCCIL